MISSRFAVPVAALLALALVPTVIHSYREARIVDGLTTEAVPATLAGMTSTPTARRATWVKNTLESEDWFERVYRREGLEVTVFTGRSYDLKRLYHHPELGLLRGGTETVPAGTVRLPSRPDIPLHLVETRQGDRRGLTVYALLYDGEFIENPITFQLRTSAQLLLSGRKPMTLFMASAAAGDKDHVEQAPATQVLFTVVDAFLAQRSQPRADQP